jgi:hypothetical protein
MSYSIIISSIARAHLGQEFREEVRVTIDKLIDNPVDYQVYTGKIRKIKLDRFPYSVYYEKDEIKNTIVIFAVLHFKRNPDDIKALLGK